MPSTSPAPSGRPGAGGAGKKILGMPPMVAVLVIGGGVAVVYLLWSSHKSSSQQGQQKPGQGKRTQPRIVIMPGGHWGRRGGRA